MFRKCLLSLLVLPLLLKAEGLPCPGEWKLSPEIRHTFSAKQAVFSPVFPGNVQVRVEPERQNFRPERSLFEKPVIQFRIRTEGFTKPLKAWVFVTDKDGTWFQSEKEFALPAEGETSLSLRTDLPGRELLPSGHTASWNGLFSSVIYSTGLSICSDDMQSGIITVFRPERTGERKKIPLAFTDLTMPVSGEVFQKQSIRFNLTKEYFNPFDPEEIAVDFEVLAPGEKESRIFPAFYSTECELSRHFTMEKIRIAGAPFWEFRFVPRKPGEYRLRLRAKDKKETVLTPWHTFMAEKSSRRGFVRVSKRNPLYFEFDDGTFFFPVGLNIHCSTDPRSERVFKFGHLPDRGIDDYEEYFSACHQAGIDLTEIWMAAWTCAIEWNASRQGFYGLGRYNPVTAWKLDRILELAEKNHILINLVLDNHGKLATAVDPEWGDSPFNRDTVFARANGGFLSSAEEFWSNPAAKKYNEQRNRFIAARWGADPNIFAFEFWSEVDLVGQGRKAYDSGAMAKWHKESAVFLRRNIQGDTLLSTHVCNDIGTTLWWRKVTMDLPELTHICSDAYRSPGITIAEQLDLHKTKLGKTAKPAIVTEYGGSTGASGKQNQIADLHGGMWLSLFTRQAGIPMLWWHDLVHRLNLYQHYRGFRNFLTGIDLRKPGIKTGDLHTDVTIPAHFRKDRKFYEYIAPFAVRHVPFTEPVKGKYLTFPDGTGFGWLFHWNRMHRYPEGPLEKVPAVGKIRCSLNVPLKNGEYLVLFYDTISGKPAGIRCVRSGKDGLLSFPAPDIRLDLAFKLLPAGVMP